MSTTTKDITKKGIIFGDVFCGGAHGGYVFCGGAHGVHLY